MKLEKFAELAQAIEQCVYHSELKNGYISSLIHVCVPTVGKMDHMLSLERRVLAEVNASNEQNAAAWIIGRQLEYLLEHAETFSEPVYQQSEDGEEVHIGNTVIFIDRTRLKFPELKEDNGQLYLDCTVPL